MVAAERSAKQRPVAVRVDGTYPRKYSVTKTVGYSDANRKAARVLAILA